VDVDNAGWPKTQIVEVAGDQIVEILCARIIEILLRPVGATDL